MAHEDPAKRACLAYPPRHIREVDAMMNAAFNNPAKKLQRSPSISGSDSSSSHGRGPIITYNLAPQSSSDCLIPPPGRRRPEPSSPLRGIDPKDYSDHGLLVFMEWLDDKYADSDFLRAYEKLKAKKIGVDLLGSISAECLSDRCDIIYGTALRMVEAYPIWKESLKDKDK